MILEPPSGCCSQPSRRCSRSTRPRQRRRRTTRQGAPQAITLPADVTGTTAESTIEPTEPAGRCGSMKGTVWYAFTATGDDRVVVRLQAAGDLDAQVSVFLRQPRDAADRLRPDRPRGGRPGQLHDADARELPGPRRAARELAARHLPPGGLPAAACANGSRRPSSCARRDRRPGQRREHRRRVPRAAAGRRELPRESRRRRRRVREPGDLRAGDAVVRRVVARPPCRLRRVRAVHARPQRHVQRAGGGRGAPARAAGLPPAGGAGTAATTRPPASNSATSPACAAR